MDEAFFEEAVTNQIDKCRATLVNKAVEYATEDRLHNFRVAAKLQGITDAQALAGMMAKHTTSVYDMINSEDDISISQWEEKITDHINYLLILSAMIAEQNSFRIRKNNLLMGYIPEPDPQKEYFDERSGIVIKHASDAEPKITKKVEES